MGRSGRKESIQAAQESKEEAARYRAQTEALQKQTAAAQMRAQRVLMRSLRARGSGFFESDFLGGNNQPLGGGDVM